MFNDIDTAKSYATEENLIKALTKLEIDKLQHIVVRNRAGRWTAIFILRGGDVSTYAMAIANCGFKVIG